MTVRVVLTVGCLVLTLSATLPAADLEPEKVEFFEKKVRPVLVEHCQPCHGPQKQRGGLRLDSRAAVLKGGDTRSAIVPGQPDKSLLVLAISYKDTDLRMPKKTRLTDDQIADLTNWVKMGAPWPEETAVKPVGGGETFSLKERLKHWVWQPIQSVSLPTVKDRSWPRTPIDAFLLGRLEAASLTPGPAADKRTLLRRVTFDLTGLPPTPAEIDDFLAAESPTAFEKVVERLLANPAYGERWGRHWLDLVRYAETLGHEFDFDFSDAYHYRDYTVRAFNADLPYDQLVKEHIAGDLLKTPRRHPEERFNESLLGTGFWHFGEAKHSPVDIRGDQADRLDNQIDVFSKTFLGLTLSCARCHDHKFDALTTKDYYALIGYLQSSRYQKAFIDDPEAQRQASHQIVAIRDEARKLAVAAVGQKLSERAGELAEYLLRGKTTLEERREHLKKLATRPPEATPHCVRFEDFCEEDYRDWFVTGEAFGNGPTKPGDLVLQPQPANPIKEVFGRGVAHSGLIAGKLQGVLRSRTFTIDKSRIFYRVAGTGGQIRLVIDGFQLIQEPIYGGLAFAVNHGDKLQWRQQDLSMWKGHRAYIEIFDDGPGFIAVDQILFADEGHPANVANPLLMKPLEDPNLKETEALIHHFRGLFEEISRQWTTGQLDKTKDGADRIALLNEVLPIIQGGEAPAELAALPDMLDRCRKIETDIRLSRRAPAMADGSAVNEHVHIRGNHKNLGEVVPRRMLEGLNSPQEQSDGSGRLELAQRLVDPTNPLVARVMVNRIWMHHFGEGLVRSVDNFGVLGQPPTHPELLDWLAVEFVHQGWSIKHLHRLLVLSSAYRMASRAEPIADEKDPKNELLHRMPIRRLEAEAIRDAMLSASGCLHRKMGGPGVMPFLTPEMLGRGRPGSSGPLDGDGRRSLYINVRRNFLTPMFLAFDFPQPFTTMGKRSVSNVPAQALTLMNNPFVVQQAELWARRILSEPNLTAKERIGRMYETAFGRLPTDAEMADALAFLEDQGKHYGRIEDPRGWTDLAHVLLNVKEFIFLN